MLSCQAWTKPRRALSAIAKDKHTPPTRRKPMIVWRGINGKFTQYSLRENGKGECWKLRKWFPIFNVSIIAPGTNLYGIEWAFIVPISIKAGGFTIDIDLHSIRIWLKCQELYISWWTKRRNRFKTYG